MSRPNRISFAFLIAVLVLTGWLNLGSLLLAVLFSYYTLRKLDFAKPRGRWPAVAMFVVVLAALAYGVAYLADATVAALPGIAEKAVPAIIQWAGTHHIRLPFTDFDSLKEQALQTATNEAKNIGRFVDIARGATAQFIYLSVGCLVAISLFLDPHLEMDPPKGAARDNLYTLCCEEITRRFDTFYESFDLVMNGQILISIINTLLTAIFMAALGLPHMLVAVGVTFVAGLVPVVGNLISSILVVSIGFIVSPAKGLGALAFLAVMHYVGFYLSSKIIGSKIKSSMWLTLLALVIGERLMGVTGVVLSPIVLHYIRIEASRVSVHH